MWRSDRSTRVGGRLPVAGRTSPMDSDSYTPCKALLLLRQGVFAVRPVPQLLAEVEAEAGAEWALALSEPAALAWMADNLVTAALVTERAPASARYRRLLLKRLVGAIEGAGSVVPDALMMAFVEATMAPRGDDDYGEAFHRLFLRNPGGPPYTTADLVLGSSVVAVTVSSSYGEGVGMALWPSGVVLARYLDAVPLDPPPASVLELGAGVGLTGLFLRNALAAETRLVLTDGVPPVLDRLRENVALNGMAGTVDCALLDWSDAATPAGAGAMVSEFGQHADVLIAADCVYDPTIVDPFVAVLAAFLVDGPSQYALIASTMRQPETYALFTAAAAAAGLILTDLPLDPVASAIEPGHTVVLTRVTSA